MVLSVCWCVWSGDVFRPVDFQRGGVGSNDREVDLDAGDDYEFAKGVGEVDVLFELHEDDDAE